MSIDDRKMTLTLKINNSQHFKCVLLDFDSNVGRVNLKLTLIINNSQYFKCVLLDFDSNVGRVFETSVFFVLESSAKDVCFVRVDMKQNIHPIAVQENA